MIGGVAAAFAAWSYLEAVLAGSAPSSLSFGAQITLLGFIGGAAAYVAKIPLLFRLYRYEARRAALLASSLAAFVAFVLLELGLELASYLFLSASYGVAYAAIFAFVLHDFSHEKWRETLALIFATSFALSSALLAWNPRSSIHAFAAVAGVLLALSFLVARRALLPSLWVKSVEIFSDIVALRRLPDINVNEEIARTAAILGSVAALKVALLSAGDLHATGLLALFALGSSLGAVLSYISSSLRLTAILAAVALAALSITSSEAAGLLLLGAVMAHGQLSVILTVLEMRPREAPRAMALVSAAVAAGSAAIGLISSVDASMAVEIAMAISLLSLLVAAVRSRRSWDY